MLYSRWRESPCCNANKNSKHHYHCSLPVAPWQWMGHCCRRHDWRWRRFLRSVSSSSGRKNAKKKKAPKDQEAPEPVVDTQVGKFCGALKTTTVFKDCLVTIFFFWNLPESASCNIGFFQGASVADLMASLKSLGETWPKWGAKRESCWTSLAR